LSNTSIDDILHYIMANRDILQTQVSQQQA